MHILSRSLYSSVFHLDELLTAGGAPPSANIKGTIAATAAEQIIPSFICSPLCSHFLQRLYPLVFSASVHHPKSICKMDNNETQFDPFEELETEQMTYARPRKIDSLIKGKCYTITKILKKQSEFKDHKTGHFPFNTIVQYDDAGLKFSTILPKCFNDKTDRWIQTMNSLIDKKIGPKMVYYGKCGMGYEVALLRHTEEPNQDRIEALKLIEASQAEKRSMPSSDDDISPKKVKLE